MTAADDFWEASSITTASASTFASRVLSFEPVPDTIHPFVGPAPLVQLRAPHDRVQRLLERRRSDRAFSPSPLAHRHVEGILAAVGPGGERHRLVPEAGAIETVFTYAMARRVKGPLAGRSVRYDHRRHAVADIGPVPADAELRRLFLVDDDDPLPQLVVVFVLDLVAPTAKYGERATRFALQSVGHAAQNIGLRLAADGLRGYVLGGGVDHEVLRALGLAHMRARYGGAVACGR